MKGAKMKQQILDYLKERGGECAVHQMKIPGVRLRSLSSILQRLYVDGLLTRRSVFTPRGEGWSYSFVDSTGPCLRGEPDYVYYLRNLGRNNEHDSSGSDCGTADCDEAVAGDERELGARESDLQSVA
jgi:hypothetical protein